MIFLNKKTGVSWEINNIEHIKRLLSDEDYEMLVDNSKEKFDYEKNIIMEEKELEKMNYNELCKLAEGMGINSSKVKKVDLIQAILKLQELAKDKKVK